MATDAATEAPPGNGAGTVAHVLVTGATGFIGRNVVPRLTARGQRVRVLARDADRARALGDVEVHVGDLTRPESLAGIEQDVEAVVHCAGMLGTWGIAECALREVNVQGVLHLLERFRGTGLRRFVHVSAGGVTGPLGRKAAAESTVCRPRTAYEKSKLAGEQAALAFGRDNDVPLVVVRPTFTYGPGDMHKLALFRAVRRKRLAFIGTGNSVLHPVFIDDAVSGLLAALDKGVPGEVYIIGGEGPVSKRELVETIAEALDISRPHVHVPAWIAWPAACVLEAAGRVFGFEPILTRSRVLMMTGNYGYSIQKARTDLEYCPRTGLAAGIAATVEDYTERGLL